LPLCFVRKKLRTFNDEEKCHTVIVYLLVRKRNLSAT